MSRDLRLRLTSSLQLGPDKFEHHFTVLDTSADTEEEIIVVVPASADASITIGDVITAHDYEDA